MDTDADGDPGPQVHSPKWRATFRDQRLGLPPLHPCESVSIGGIFCRVPVNGGTNRTTSKSSLLTLVGTGSTRSEKAHLFIVVGAGGQRENGVRPSPAAETRDWLPAWRSSWLVDFCNFQRPGTGALLIGPR